MGGSRAGGGVRLRHWWIWLVTGVLVGLTLGFVLGLTRPRAKVT